MSSQFPHHQRTLPITETSNELTVDIDISNPDGIVRLLRQSDAQLFSGYSTYPGMYDSAILNSMALFAQQLEDAMLNHSNEPTLVIATGCGTSGRLAHFCSKTYNVVLQKLFPHVSFDYLIAAGDRALVSSQELAEDKPDFGELDLLNLKKTHSGRVVFVGITCGLSAPYVAGQLEFIMANPSQFTCSVLMGFNPVELSRNVPLEHWDNKSFRQVAEKFEAFAKIEPTKYVILNPVVGPESITGSTRMKGGSGTKILMDTCFGAALLRALEEPSKKKPMLEYVLDMLHGFNLTYRDTYLALESLSSLVESAGQSLNDEAHVYYLGCENAGIWGFIDASEQPPTYGANYNDVRGFLVDGWQAYGNRDKDIMEKHGASYFISVQHFMDTILPTVTSKDTVIALALEHQLTQSLEHISLIETALNHVATVNKAKTWWILVSNENAHAFVQQHVSKWQLQQHNVVQTKLSRTQLSNDIYLHCFAEFSLKLALNAITTGAHVLKGMTFGNRMINLKLSNHKLFFRAIGTVKSIMKVSDAVARECILRSIHQIDTVDSNYEKMTIEQHIVSATPRNYVVPIALLLAAGAKTVDEAKETLATTPIIRNAIAKFAQH